MTRFSKFGILSHNLCVGKQMIPYFGRHSCKFIFIIIVYVMYVRFGFKAWCLCSSSG